MSPHVSPASDAARHPTEVRPARPAPAARRRPGFESALAIPRQPFLYLAAALIAGILLDHGLQMPRPLIAALAVTSLAWSAGFIFVKKATPATLALLVSLAVVGVWLSRVERDSLPPSRLKRLLETQVITPDDPVELTGVLVAPPEPAPGVLPGDTESQDQTGVSQKRLNAFFLDLEAEKLNEATEASGVVRLFISPGDEWSADAFEGLALDTGSRLRVLVRLERARSYNNPGSPDFNDFLERRGYDLKGTIKSPLLIEPLARAKTNRALAWLYDQRRRLMNAIDERFKPPVGGTLKAMLVGNYYFLDAAVVERLRKSATFHTLIISGMHISIIAWVLLRLRWDFWRKSGKHTIQRHRIGRVLATILVLWAYTVMVGLAPPVVRASAMISIGLIGPLIFRRAASLNTVSLAAFVMLAWKPALVFDPGFQLSFIAVAAIVALALPLIERLKQIGQWRPSARSPHPPACPPRLRAFAELLFWNERDWRRENNRSPIRYRLEKSAAACGLNRLRLQSPLRAVVLLIITSTAIQLATLPLMAVYFNRVAPVGIVLNITAGLLTAVLMLGGLAVIAIAPVSAGLAGWGIAIAGVAHTLLVNSIVPFEKLAFATFRVAHYEGWSACIYALYFLPLAGLSVLLDRWRPVDEFYPVDRPPPDDAEKEALGATPTDGPANRSHQNKVQAEGAAPSLPRVAASPRRRVALSLCLVGLLALMIAVVRPMAGTPTGRLTVHFLDVGQGDAALIVFPRGATMLVDAGGELQIGKVTGHTKSKAALPAGGSATGSAASPPAGNESVDADESQINDEGFAVGEAVVSRFLWSQRRTAIDYALVTHADADHIAGFSRVLENFQVGQGLIGHRPDQDIEYTQFAKAISAQRIPLGSLAAGQRFDIDGVRVEVLWPPRAASSPVTSNNNDSVVLRLVYGAVAILLAGDIEAPAEAALIRSGVELRADVVKVAHHGSKTSSTDAFLDRVRPRCAIISVGERSRFGHPHQIVVDRYESRGIRLLRTGRDGTVTVETDGRDFYPSTYRGNR